MDTRTDARFAPAYGVSEAAHYLRMSSSTLRSWISGIQYRSKRAFEPVITTPLSKDSQQVSFVNLVEAHILVALRRKYSISLQQIRKALDYLEEDFPEYRHHPLALSKFATDGKQLFVDHLGQLINLKKKGQLEMLRIIEIYLHRIEHDVHGPLVLYPFISDPFFREDMSKAVMMNPYISFGRPVLTGRGVSTEMIYERFNAGERIIDLADDYGRSAAEIEEAIRYESATRAAA